jgi:hypothetical protein
LVLLAGYNMFAFGSALGPFTGSKAAGATLRQAAMICLGLHLDQTQGIFLQQPLLLLGLPGLAILVRRSPGLASTLVVAYLSIVLPNSFHDCWYGCNSFTGRFMWSVAALWVFPLAFLYREARGSRMARVLSGIAAAAALFWQIVLMRAWWSEGPQSMYRVLRADVVQRDHVFYRQGWSLLPSFYDFKGYLSYVPNLVALAVVLGFVVVGVGIAVRVCRDGNAAPQMRERDAVSTGRTTTSTSAFVTSRSARQWALAVVVAGIAAVALAYELPRTVRPRGVPLIDLTERLANADKGPTNAPAGAFVITTETIAGDTRRAICAHPPTRIAWTLWVPPNAWLETGIGVDERSWAGKGVVFHIAILDGLRHRQATWKPMTPRVFRGDRRWVPLFVDLSDYAWRPVEIVFSTETNPHNADDPGSDIAYWAAPAIYSRR